jgi:hypothetical protein
MNNLFKSILCVLGIHSWEYYNRLIARKKSFTYFRKERKCSICQKKQFLTRTPLCNMLGNNKWTTYE